jgi:hypothetical protein
MGGYTLIVILKVAIIHGLIVFKSSQNIDESAT